MAGKGGKGTVTTNRAESPPFLFSKIPRLAYRDFKKTKIFQSRETLPSRREPCIVRKEKSTEKGGEGSKKKKSFSLRCLSSSRRAGRRVPTKNRLSVMGAACARRREKIRNSLV